MCYYQDAGHVKIGRKKGKKEVRRGRDWEGMLVSKEKINQKKIEKYEMKKVKLEKKDKANKCGNDRKRIIRELDPHLDVARWKNFTRLWPVLMLPHS